jgi:CheY-like chemotaxis protein
MSLRKLGFVDVLLAVDGTECVAAVEAEQAAGRGDMLLVLMDSSMEPMDGLEATKIIRQAHAAREEGTSAAAAAGAEGAAGAVFSSSPDLSTRSLPPSGSVANVNGSSPFSSVRTLRRFRPPYIIAQTANVTLEAQRACIAVGTDHFLPKPVRLDALVAALRLGHRTLESYRHEQQAK